MELRSISVLEFPRLLEYLASFSVSEAGQEACLSLQPLQSLEAIRHESILFEEGYIWLQFFGKKITPFPPLKEFLEGISEIAPDIPLMWALRFVLVQAKTMIDSLTQERHSDSWSHWRTRCQQAAFPSQSFSALFRCISDDGLIKDDASPELTVVRGEIRNLHQQCTKKVKDYAKEYNIQHFLQDDYMTLSSDRYVLPLKSNFKGRLQGIVHDYSQTGETCYFEPLFLVEINNRLQGLKQEEREEERKILTYLVQLIKSEIVGIQSAYTLLVELDVLCAKCTLADCYEGKLLDLEENFPVALRKARHPLLALSSSDTAKKAFTTYLRSKGMDIEPINQQSSLDSVIPSDIELHYDQKALIISGGNAGGKTVSLKTLGLTALMSLCALPVPVESGSSLPYWKNIYAFIGDEQSLENHVSTFTAQITHLSSIWPKLNKYDLIILDEFGAGTDPSQGAALAQAVIDRLIAHNVHVIAATHFPALKAYALSTEGVRSASVLFEPTTKKPLYQLVYEQVGASLALDVAEEHGLPKEVLERAKQYLLMSGEDTTVLVERLNALAVEREKDILQLQKEQKKYEEKKKKLEAQYEKEKEKLLSSIQSEIKNILGEWKKGRLSNKQALKELAKTRSSLSDSSIKKESNFVPINLEEISIGQTIKHIPWNRLGVVQEIDIRKKRLRLNFDGVSLWTGLETVEKNLGNNVAENISKTSGILGKYEISSRYHLDLRGERADVAINELDKFLDKAILQGRSEIEIIHGKGTGLLRKALHSHLKTLPFVTTYRLAPESQGGDGVTLVDIK